MTMHYSMAGALKGITEFGKKCYQAMSDIPVTEDPDVDSSPIALFELFGIHDWLKLAGRFNSHIGDTSDYESH